MQARDAGVGSDQPWYRGLGYWPLGDPLSPQRQGRVVFGHSGAGGSLGFADATHHIAFGLTKNRMVDSPPGNGTAERVYGAVLAALNIPPIT